MQRLGIEGRIVIAFTMAGGMVVSGLSVATASMAGTISPGFVISATVMLFIAGSVLGWAHAVFLGYAGRDPSTERHDVLKRVVLGGLWAVPALLLALFAAVGIALSAAVVRNGGIAAWPLTALCWVAGIGICVWAVVVGTEAFRNAMARYPEARPTAITLATVMMVLLVAFERVHPEVWGTNYRVTTIGAAMLAFGATIWIGAPLVIGLVHLLYTHFRKQRSLVH